MDEKLKAYLQQKYSDQLGDINTAQAFANLGDVIAGQKVGSQSPYYTEQRQLAGQQTLGRMEREDEKEWRRAQAQEALDLRKEQLAQANGLLSDRIAQYWMQQGVTMSDPSSTWIDATAKLAADVVLLPNVFIQGTLDSMSTQILVFSPLFPLPANTL